MRINKKLVKRLIKSKYEQVDGEYKNVEYIEMRFLPVALSLLLVAAIVGVLLLTVAYDVEKWLLHKPTTPTNTQTSDQTEVTETGSSSSPSPSPFDPNAGPDGKMTTCQKQQYWLHRDFVNGVDVTTDMLLALYYQKECER